MEFQNQVFSNDWVNLASVCGIGKNISTGIGEIYMQKFRSPAAATILESLECSTILARLVLAVASKSVDNLRIYGPGSSNFERLLNEKLGVTIPQRDLSAFVAVSMSSLLDVGSLAKIWSLHDDMANSVGHLMGNEKGLGDIFIGLVPLPDAAHLQWFAKCFNISAPTYLGLLCIASHRMDTDVDSSSRLYVEEAVVWFITRNPTGMCCCFVLTVAVISILLYSI